jgi:hypothetical protein
MTLACPQTCPQRKCSDNLLLSLKRGLPKAARFIQLSRHLLRVVKQKQCPAWRCLSPHKPLKSVANTVAGRTTPTGGKRRIGIRRPSWKVRRYKGLQYWQTRPRVIDIEQDVKTGRCLRGKASRIPGLTWSCVASLSARFDKVYGLNEPWTNRWRVHLLHACHNTLSPHNIVRAPRLSYLPLI